MEQLFTVKLINDKETEYTKDLIKGSVIRVTEEYEDTYVGLWCSCFGSWHVEVLKENCEVLDNV